MNERQTANALETLLIAASTFLTLGLASLFLYLTEPKEYEDKYTVKDFGTAPDYQHEIIPKFEPIYNPYLEGYYELWGEIESLDIWYLSVRTEYLGRYFVTAYCPEECGFNGSNYPKGWKTSSGAICHYSSDPYTPTTCAIDRNYHKFGELLMIDGKIYVTEDTGSGVKGLWVDCFVETMSEVQAWNTGYKSVYSVSYVAEKIRAKERKNYHEHFKHSRLHMLCGCWCPCGCID